MISDLDRVIAIELIDEASFNEGLYFPASSLIIVSLLTPTISASCSCVSSFNCLYLFSLQMNLAILFFL